MSASGDDVQGVFLLCPRCHIKASGYPGAGDMFCQRCGGIMGRVIDVAIEGALLQAQEQCVRLQQTADYWHALCRERDQLIIRMQRDTERMDWIEKNLCRAGEIRNDEGVTVKLCRVWSVMGELETLRETIDCLMEKTKKEKP